MGQPILLGTLTASTAAIVLSASKAQAKDASEIARIAKAITVRIVGAGAPGSGVLFKLSKANDEQNNSSKFKYQIITAWHVVKDNSPEEEISIFTPDLIEHIIYSKDIKQIRNTDLAIITLFSKNKYSVSKPRNIDNYYYREDIYVGGFPIGSKGSFIVSSGELVAETSISIGKDKDGYNLLYKTPTKPGMSGGGVFDEDGFLVAIHGRGEKDNASSNFLGIPTKTGVNLGLSLRHIQDKNYFITDLNDIGESYYEQKNLFDYYLIEAEIYKRKNKRNLKGSIKYYDKAINLGEEIFRDQTSNSSLSSAYLERAVIKGQTIQIPSDINEVRADLNKAKSYDSESSWLYDGIMAILLLTQQNKESEAITLLDKIVEQQSQLETDEEDPLSYFGLFYSLYMRGMAKASTSIRDFKGCIKDISKALDIEKDLSKALDIDDLGEVPDKDQLYMYRGLCYEGIKENKLALIDYNQAIQINPNKAEAHIKIAIQEEKNELFKNALSRYDEAIRLDRENYEGYLFKAKLLAKLGKSRKAIENYKIALILNPKESSYAHEIGKLEELLGNTKIAIKFYTKAIEINPNKFYIYMDRANLKEKENDLEGALFDYTKAIEIKPEISEFTTSSDHTEDTISFAYSKRSFLLEELNRLEESISDRDMAIKLNPSATNYRLRAYLYMRLNDFNKCISDSTKVINRYDSDEDDFFIRALAFHKLGKNKESLSDINKAIKIEPNKAHFHTLRAENQLILNNKKEAIKSYTNAIQLEPLQPRYYAKRASIQLELDKNPERACNDIKKSASLNYNYSIDYLAKEEGAWCRNMPD